MIRVVQAEERHVVGYHAVLDAVARERRWLQILEAPPVERSAAFVRELVAGLGVQVVAVDESDKVVGWCDIVRGDRETIAHTGSLGMGLLKEYRGRGLGRKLMDAAIAAAKSQGVERVELEVYASNAAAVTLYRKLGFREEGRKLKARKIDGAYDDSVVMALFP
ncbi:MAG: putative acetyltransferase [Elusimicrobia bacterium]|nr:MAG: putative acetyltransferase [Elusimicrobiota bacterium]